VSRGFGLFFWILVVAPVSYGTRNRSRVSLYGTT
jgi:hypothetical protein